MQCDIKIQKITVSLSNSQFLSLQSFGGNSSSLIYTGQSLRGGERYNTVKRNKYGSYKSE